MIAVTDKVPVSFDPFIDGPGVASWDGPAGGRGTAGVGINPPQRANNPNPNQSI